MMTLTMMTLTDKKRLRAQVEAALPDADVRVVFLACKTAPSFKHPTRGAIGFRSWGNEYVVLLPARPLEKAEDQRLAELLDDWDIGKGRSYLAAEDGSWPFAPDLEPEKVDYLWMGSKDEEVRA